MKVAIVNQEYIPFPTGFGSAIHVWSLIETLYQRGHEVHICCYAFESDHVKATMAGEIYERARTDLQKRGISVHTLPYKPNNGHSPWRARASLARKMVWPRVDDFFDGPAYKNELSELLKQIKPAVVIPWMVDGVAATDLQFVCDAPRMAFLTDLDHLDRKYRRQLRPAADFRGRMYQFVDAVAERKLPRLMTGLLQRCECVFDHAAHHCQWLRQNGVPQARYLPVPVLDQAGEHWERDRDRELGKNRIQRISLIGNVTGIATLPGIRLLADEILPALERLRPRLDFEVHLVGGGQLSKSLASALDKPYLKRRGYVKDIQQEFRASDVFLVPTPLNVGFRTRISEAFSFGTCVVAHASNCDGMPELRHEVNTLIGSTGVELAEACARCLQDPQLRRTLGAAGRHCFERELDGRLICGKMVDAAESIAAGTILGQ